MMPDFTHIHLALAITPFTGAIAFRGFWAKRRTTQELRLREQQAEKARREAMRAMQDALVAAAAAEKTRNELLARMSHELRTPLNAVIGFSRVLENNKAGNQRPEDLHLLGRVRASGELLLRLVEDVLDQSNIERGQLSLELADTNLSDIVSRVLKTFRHSATAKGLRLQSELPPDVPLLPLDAGRFEQVLEHLVDNALKFTSEGIVKVTLVSDAATHRPARLIVADTGIGIPASRLHEIFEPFTQVDASAQRSFGGPVWDFPSPAACVKR